MPVLDNRTRAIHQGACLLVRYGSPARWTWYYLPSKSKSKPSADTTSGGAENDGVPNDPIVAGLA